MISNVDFEATVRYRRGADAQAVVDSMVADGFTASEAKAAVLKVQTRITADDRRRGMFNLMIGLLIFAAGMGITLMTMSRGSVIVYAYGAVIVGAGVALLGANQIMSAGKDSALAKQNLSDHFR